jgi:flavin reductase (DIM6/NTAB) family NADH-FMN oxidoreductase RutF
MLMCVNQSAALYRALNYAQEFAIKILSRAHISIFRLRSGGTRVAKAGSTPGP